jgi:hypothetical protein
VPGVVPLHVLLPFQLAAGQRDLGHLSHLGRPAPEGLDKLTEGKAACGLGHKLVFMDVLHGARILAAVRGHYTSRASWGAAG